LMAGADGKIGDGFTFLDHGFECVSGSHGPDSALTTCVDGSRRATWENEV
jgi:hypothetical protein